MVQKTNEVYLELHSNTQSFVSNDTGDCCCCAPPLDATSFENGYPTTEELVCSAVSEERVCNSCATCISHTISHEATQPNIHLCLVHEIRAEWVHLQKQVSLVGPLCLIKLWTVFGIVSNAADKNQRAELVVSCS
jgi:hypothetical protein